MRRVWNFIRTAGPRLAAAFGNARVLSKIGVSLAILLFASVAIGVAGWRSTVAMEEAAAATDQANKVLGELSRIVTAMVDQETGLRGYLLSARDDFLGHYRSGATNYDTALANVRALTADWRR